MGKTKQGIHSGTFLRKKLSVSPVNNACRHLPHPRHLSQHYHAIRPQFKVTLQFPSYVWDNCSCLINDIFWGKTDNAVSGGDVTRQHSLCWASACDKAQISYNYWTIVSYKLFFFSTPKQSLLSSSTKREQNDDTMYCPYRSKQEMNGISKSHHRLHGVAA